MNMDIAIAAAATARGAAATSSTPKPAVAVLENVSRRGFIRSAATAAGLVVAVQLVPFRGAEAVETYPTGGDDMPHGIVNDPHVFVSIDPSGLVTIVTHRSEMGTGIRTSLPMVVADELEADWTRVKIVQAPGDEPRYGNQDTDGSRSMRHFIQAMRQCGAAMRQMLEQAAATKWGVPVAECRAQNHEVVHSGSGKKLGFGEVARAAMDLPTPPTAGLKLKDQGSFRYMGKGNVQITDLQDIVTGNTHYGQDTRLPGMKYAVVAHPPVVGGKVKSYDSADALKVPGVEKIVEIEGHAPPAKFAPLGGLAVVATNTWAAIKGREALKIEWDDGPNGSYDTESFVKEMRATAQKPGVVVRNEGDAEKALGSATKVITAEYHQPHLAHAPMEPPAATAVVANGSCELWACVQSPYGTREDVAKLLGMPVESVKVNVTLLGGGFGRKSKCDYVQEAALVAKALNGTPVKLIWTREDDIQNGFYHTTSVDRLEAGLDSSGKVTAMRHRIVSPSIFSTFMPDPKHLAKLELGLGAVDTPFDIPNLRIENGEAAAHVRIGWFRSVLNIPRAFAMQSFVAELAHAAGKDHRDFLLELLGPGRVIDMKKAGLTDEYWNYGDPTSTFPIDTARLANVIKVATDASGWGRKMPKGRGLGLAAHRSFVTYVATVVEVEVDDKGKLSITQVNNAMDCGFGVNPERIRSQSEGAAVMGTSLALYGEVSFKDGRAVESNYDSYEVVRMGAAPLDVRTHIVQHGIDTPPSGVGEPALPPFAPALANAIFNATGKRIRDLPIKDQNLRSI